MGETTVISIFTQATSLLVLITAPILGVSLLVGLVISVFQAVTQINEATLSYVPKIAAVGVTLAFLGPWMLQLLTNYTTQLFTSVTTLVR